MGVDIGYRVEINGKDRTDDIGKNLISLLLTDEIGQKTDSCSLLIADPENKITRPKLGAELKVYLSEDGGKLALFGRYQIKSVSRDEREVRITGKGFDPGSKIKSTGTHYYAQKTLKEVVDEIAKRNGVGAVVSEDFNLVRGDFNQIGESDISYLQKLASENGAVIKVQGEKILFTKKSSGQSASGKNLPPLSLDLKALGARYSYSQDDSQAAGTVIARVFDKATFDRLEIVRGSGEPRKILPDSFSSKALAESAADAFFRDSTESNESLSLTLPLTPSVYAERSLSVSGLSPWVDGRWIVTSVKHEIGKSFKTSMSLRKSIKEDLS